MANDNSILMANFSHIPITAMYSSSCLSSSLSDTEILRIPKGNGVSCSLKRKRPPNIEIPNVLRELSADIFEFNKAPMQNDGSACFSDSGVAVFSMKGKKKFMEDAHKIVSSSNDTKGFFGVYDGHGGSKAAKFVAENLHQRIFEMLEKFSGDGEKEAAIRAGYLKTDEEFLKQNLSSGVCCVTALIERQEMVISNLGDCRAVLCRGGVAEVLTTDHRAESEDERKRIEGKGGFVVSHRGSWRVNGTLAVSRSIGDTHLKNWVVAEPETKVISLTPDMEYLVLASDGLWDEVGGEEAIDILIQTCSRLKKDGTRCLQIQDKVHSSNISLPKSPRISVVKLKRMCHLKQNENHLKQGEDYLCCENASPPSKCQGISKMKQKKIKTDSFPSNENEGLLEEPANRSELVGVCKELVNLAVSRGSLDDITVMILDLQHYHKRLG